MAERTCRVCALAQKMEPEGRLKSLSSLTEYELFLCDVFEKAGYPVSSWARKMQFYNYVLENEAKNDKEYMHSEYPTTPEESFGSTGNPVFPTAHLLKMHSDALSYWNATPPVCVEAVLESSAVGLNNSKRMSFIQTPVSSIKVYEMPIKGEKYIIGVDPAHGGEDGDYSEGVVLKESTMEEVCTIKDKIEQTELAEMVVNDARWYNNAIIVPERNMGSTLIEFIRLLNYHRMYIDPVSTQTRTLYGVHMSKPVKDEAIRRFRFMIINGIWKTKDKFFIDDAMHFVWKETQGGFKKAVAAGVHQDTNEKYHDDSVMARLNLVSILDMRRWKLYVDKIELEKVKMKNMNKGIISRGL